MRKVSLNRVLDQTGSGLTILLVVFTLLELVFVGAYNYSHVVDVRKSSTTLAKGQLAQSLSHTACLMTMNRFVERINQSGDPLFAMVRQSTIETLDEQIQLDDNFLGTTGLKLYSSGVKVHWVSETQGPLPDRFGILEFHSSVGFESHGYEVFRKTTKVYREFRAPWVGFPKPFGKTSLFLEDPTRLIHGESMNQGVRESIASVKETAKRIKNIKLTKNRLLDELEKFQGLDSLDQISRLIDDLEIQFSLPDIYYYPREFHLISSKADIDLESLRLPKKINELSRQIENLDSSNWKTLNEISSILSQLEFITEDFELSILKEDLSEYITTNFPKVDRFIEKQQEKLEILEQFQGHLKPIPRSGLTEGPEPASQFDFDLLRERALFVIEGNHETVTRELSELRNKLGVLNGLVYIESSGEALTLEGDFKGKLLIAVNGNVLIKNLRNAKEDYDRLNVICNGKVKLEGNNRLNLYTTGPVKTNRMTMNMQGTLYLQDYSETNLKGRIQSDPLNASIKREYETLFVLSPITVGTKMESS